MNWLMLRGLVREQRHWGDFPPLFEKKLKEADPKSRVFALDLPGFGTERHKTSPTSLVAIVDDLRARWQDLKKDDQPWSIFAISLGGMVGMEWCSTYPHDFKRMVLVNSSLSGLSPFHRRLMPANYPQIFSLLANPNVLTRERKILKMTTNLRDDALERIAKRYADFAHPVRPRDALAQLLAAVRFRPPQKVGLPILVLSGKGDRLVHASCSDEIAKKYGAPLIAHPTANHDLPTDEPMWLAEQVLAWNPSAP